jgi:hypothetical protein
MEKRMKQQQVPQRFALATLATLASAGWLVLTVVAPAA